MACLASVFGGPDSCGVPEDVLQFFEWKFVKMYQHHLLRPVVRAHDICCLPHEMVNFSHNSISMWRTPLMACVALRSPTITRPLTISLALTKRLINCSFHLRGVIFLKAIQMTVF
jgi:hypothetical protein